MVHGVLVFAGTEFVYMEAGAVYRSFENMVVPRVLECCQSSALLVGLLSASSMPFGCSSERWVSVPRLTE